MNARPFSLFKRKDRSCYSVAFKDKDGKYLPPVSTGKKTEAEAEQVAYLMLSGAKPEHKSAVTTRELVIKDIARQFQTLEDAGLLLDEFKRLGLVNGYTAISAEPGEDFLSFMANFWDWDTSPYVKEKLRKKHGLHRRHCKLQGQAIALHWAPFFKNRQLADIQAIDIDGFIDHMADKDLSASRKNVIIRAGTKPLRWAFSKGKIDKDPTRGHILFSGEDAKRNILTPTVVMALFKAEWGNNRAKAGNMIAAVTGMRCGEIQALRFCDLGPDCLYVGHSYNKEDGMKTTKNKEARTVDLPFPELVAMLFELAKENPWGVKPESYVFWSDKAEIL